MQDYIHQFYVYYSLYSLKGGHIRDHIGDFYRGYSGDTRSLDYNSCRGIGSAFGLQDPSMFRCSGPIGSLSDPKPYTLICVGSLEAWG